MFFFGIEETKFIKTKADMC